MRDFSIRYFLLGMFVFVGTTSLGADTWMPAKRHLQAFERGESCSIYQTLQGRAQRKLEEVVDERDHYQSLLKQRRTMLKTCARNAGVVSFVSDKDEARLAQACAADYAAWINLGFRMRVIREDLRTVKANLRWLGRRRTTQCGGPAKPRPTVAQAPRLPASDVVVDFGSDESEEAPHGSLSDAPTPPSLVPASRRVIPE